MSAETTRSAYDAWHSRHPVDAESDAPWHRLVKQHLDTRRDLQGKCILEIGSGRGGFACWLARQAGPTATLVASDFSRTAVRKGKAFAQERRVPRVRWVVGDIQMLAHSQNVFDTIISCETIEHVPAPATALRELAGALRPGGRLFLTTPNYLGIIGLYRLYRRLTGRPYTEEEQPINHPVMLPRTVAWVRRAGLEVLQIDAIGHYLPFPRRPPIQIAALDQPRWLMRWSGLHSLVVATKAG